MIVALGCFCTPVQGVIRVNSAGGAVWSGTDGVTVATEEGGILAITLPDTAYDHFLILSPQAFTVL